MATGEELIRLSPQHTSAHGIGDHTFGYGYQAGVLRLRSHLLANPRTDLRHLDLEMFKPDAASHQFVDTFGWDTMPDAFNNSCPSPPFDGPST